MTNTTQLSSPEVIKAAAIAIMRAAGREHVLRRLEALVNDDVIGVEGADRLWQATFGGCLVAVKDPR